MWIEKAGSMPAFSLQPLWAHRRDHIISDAQKLAGKVAIVTGAASGIGFTIDGGERVCRSSSLGGERAVCFPFDQVQHER